VEWCSTQYNGGSDDLNGTDIRVLCGGTWISNFPEFFRVDSRYRYDPHLRYKDWGFRFARA